MTADLLPALIAILLERPIEPHNCVVTLRQVRDERLARLLHYRLAKLSDATRREHCYALLDELPEQAASELLRAPRLCQALRQGGDDGQQLATLIEAAHIAAGDEHLDDWSPLGHLWLGEAPPADTPGLTRIGRRWAGPRLACGVPIDLSLPPRLVHPSAGLRQASLPDRRRLDADRAAIDEALNLLCQTVPLGFDLYHGLVGNLVLRQEASRPHECWGATSGVVIGRVVMVNTSAATSPAMLAEALLHEAVHCALDCAELVHPLLDWERFADPAVNDTRPSPWTGNPLTPHAFIHACVVWAVLHRYWREYHARFVESPGSRERQRFIERGFAASAFMVSADHAGRFLSRTAPAIMARTREGLLEEKATV
ncbi:aKG-HExxH-type peptide beta-hydroxylase [Chitinimonas lacunae]|uniref:HEXXH motif-containing putative peptide modification protein n=1 Tax=Chitinimonas lacunae TaxID=1963018 RepID=A0ABV8MY23_9NEIS